MAKESLVPALLELRHADVDAVIEQLGKIFGEISMMNPAQVIAAYNTVRHTAVLGDLKEDPAVLAILSGIHTRMVALAFGEECTYDGDGYFRAGRSLAYTFCTVLGRPCGGNDIDYVPTDLLKEISPTEL